MKTLKNKIRLLLILIALITLSCNNDSTDSTATNESKDPGHLEIIKNTNLANNSNALQAIHTNKDNSYKSYYYGSFNSNGEPENITQMVINRISDDVSLNIFFDDELNIKSCYITSAGTLKNMLITFDYSETDKTTMSVFDYDFNNNTSKIKNKYTFNNSTKTIENEVNYAGFGYGLFKYLLIISPRDLVIDPYANQQLIIQAKIQILNSIMIGAGIGIAALICTAQPLLCIAAAIVFASSQFNAANASTIDTINSAPIKSPQSPYSQTQNTQLQTKAYYVGTKSSSGVVSFGAGYYTVEYTNISFEVKIDKKKNSITSANFSATMNEIKQADSSPIPGYPSNRQIYTLNTFSLNGSTLQINFTQDINSFPQNNATFLGGLNGNKITGTLTLDRTSNGLSCVTSIPINLLLIN